jgi:tetratricopeptide (TPR) repeat protein
MERAKLLAAAVIGVAFAANGCPSSIAQSPTRFIQQPRPAGTATMADQASAVEKPAPQYPAAKTTAHSLVRFPAQLDLQAPKSQSHRIGPAAETEVKMDSRNESNRAKRASESLPIGEPTLAFSEAASPSTSNPTLSGQRSNRLQWTSGANQRDAAMEWNASPNNLSRPFDSSTDRFISSPTPLQAFGVPSNATLSARAVADASHAHPTASDSEAHHELLGRMESRIDFIETEHQQPIAPAQPEPTRASLVSTRITSDPRFAVAAEKPTSVLRVETPQGWQAIGERLNGHIGRCESLLRRGAFCSAREEAESASLLLLRHIDLHDNRFRCEPAWQAANLALREAEDFLVVQRSSADESALRRLIDAHQTPILKGRTLAEMSPLTAAQHYRLFAELELTEAAQGHPWASELLYTVGRTYQSEADADPKSVDVLRMKAMAYYRAARTTMPTNAVACNQLGYLLLQMDRNEEARETLAVAVSLSSDVAFLGNLAEASRRLGDHQTQAWAAHNVALLRSRTPLQPPLPAIVEISAEEFAAISPRAIGPKSSIESSQSLSSPAATRSASTPNNAQLR